MIVAWNNKCAVCTERYTCEKGDKCAYDLKSWLEAENTVPLELCPFKCKGCSRKMELYYSGAFYNVQPMEDVNYKGECQLRVMGKDIEDLYKQDADAIEAWNKTVRGE